MPVGECVRGTGRSAQLGETVDEVLLVREALGSGRFGAAIGR